MLKISFTEMRWVGWAIIFSIDQPEMARLQDWGRNPEQIMELIGMYFLLGLVLEFTYRKLAWGSIFPIEEGRTMNRSESDVSEWSSFVEQNPPKDLLLDILCEDGIIRNGRAIDSAPYERLIFEIEYEMSIREQQKIYPMKFAPKYWRQSKK